MTVSPTEGVVARRPISSDGGTFTGPVLFSDGSEAAPSIGFASDPAMPALGWFVCQNRFPQHFWKPDFQQHANGAEGMVALYLAASEPARHAGFHTGYSGGTARSSCGTRVNSSRAECNQCEAVIFWTIGS